MATTLISSIAVLLLSAGAVPAVHHPKLKEGLWTVHTQSSNAVGKPSIGEYTICRDQAFDDHSESLANAMKGCTKVRETFDGHRYVSEVRCSVGKTVIDSKAEVTFHGDTETHSESSSTFTPPMDGMSTMTMTMDQKYLGSCPAGVKPGDRTSADGTVTHLGKH